MNTPIVPDKIRTVFEGRIFKVQIESLTLPKGHTLEAEIVRHPGSVAIVPLTAAGEVILVRQYRHAAGRYTWELPAGSLKRNEDVLSAARRECQEEVGMVAARLEPLGTFFPTPGFCDEKTHLFRATGLRGPREGDAEAHQDEDEDIETRAFAPLELAAMIRRGDISDMTTVAALSLALPGLMPLGSDSD